MPVKNDEPTGTEQQTDQIPNETTRELTQTDRLNKRLLESFLSRINQTNFNLNIDNEDKHDKDSNNFQ